MAVSDYSTTPADNTSISGLTVTDATVADTLDNIIRQMMADIRAADDANAKTADNNTFTGDNTFQGSDTFADLTATTVDINGGSIDGTPIGATTPDEGTFDFLRVLSGTPALYLWETDATSTFRVSSIERGGDNLNFITRDSSYGTVAIDYRMATSASGATEHSFRITGTERLGVDSSGITVTGVATLDGTANTENVLPQTANTYDLGATSSGLTIRRYRTIYLQNAPDVSSDARLKDNIQDLTDAERRAAAKIKTRTFTMKDTGKKKVGYIAQEIIEAMASEGLDAFEYGLVSDGETYGVDYDAINAFRLG